MKIHRGTKFDGTIPCRWIEPRTKWEFELSALVTGLCSQYWRNRTDEDEPLPDHLSLDEIIDIVKEQYEHYGTNAVWTWGDEVHWEEVQEADAWARRLVLAVLPDIEVPKES